MKVQSLVLAAFVTTSALSAQAAPKSLLANEAAEVLGVLISAEVAITAPAAAYGKLTELSCSIDKLELGNGKTSTEATSCVGKAASRDLEIVGKDAEVVMSVLANHVSPTEYPAATAYEVSSIEVNLDQLTKEFTSSIEAK